MDYLPYLPASAKIDAIVRESTNRQRWVNQNKKGFLRYRTPFLQLSQFHAAHVDCISDTVIIGDAQEVSDIDRQVISQHLKSFMPWRKGPFSVFGIDIDAEWRSERKWHRLQPALPDLSGKIIADIGCNNGYYMFRMTPSKPRLVLGFEPSMQHYFCFKALQGMARCAGLNVDLLGVEHLPLFSACFDVIFLMGVIYHRPSPVDTLRDIFAALRPGGTLIVESQAIPGDSPVALFPTDTFAKVPGTYFVPTGACLCNWMKKAGYSNIELFCSHPMSRAEQRRTEWMVFESYDDFIAPSDPTMTVEGYPAPWRIFVKGLKKA
jgi:tRNA (mo5U34)-methyltransferase